MTDNINQNIPLSMSSNISKNKDNIGAQNMSEAGIHYSTSIKITDPDSGEVLLHTRGDQ
jgi:hypothetical protein